MAGYAFQRAEMGPSPTGGEQFGQGTTGAGAQVMAHQAQLNAFTGSSALAGINLNGSDKSSCLARHFSLDYLNKAELQKFETGLVAKEFVDQKVFLRFPIDDVERAWACLKAPQYWLSPNVLVCVLVSGQDGTEGAKYNCLNDTYEITRLRDGTREIEIKISMFEKQQDRLVKAKIIENDPRANRKDVVEIEFQQLPEERFETSGFECLKMLIFFPCFWPHLIILTVLLLIVGLILVIPHTLNCIKGNKLKPTGKYMSHAETLKLRATFQIYRPMDELRRAMASVPTSMTATPVVPEAVDIEKGIVVDEGLGMTTSVLPPGFGS